MQTASLRPPTVVQVMESPRTGSPQTFPDSPLSSAPNSPVSPARRAPSEIDMEDLQLPPLLPAPPLKRQDSSLGRESRKSRLRASAQARMMQHHGLEEKKSEDTEEDFPALSPRSQVFAARRRSTSEGKMLPFEDEMKEDPTLITSSPLSPKSAEVFATARNFAVRRVHGPVTEQHPEQEERDELFPSPVDEVDELLPRRMSPVATMEGVELPRWSPSFEETSGDAVPNNCTVSSFSEEDEILPAPTDEQHDVVSFQLSTEEHLHHHDDDEDELFGPQRSHKQQQQRQQQISRLQERVGTTGQQNKVGASLIQSAPSYDEAVTSSQEIEVSYGPHGLQPELLLDLGPSYDEDVAQVPADELGKNPSFETDIHAVPTDEKLNHPFPLLSKRSKEAQEETLLESLGIDIPLDEMDELINDMSTNASRNLTSMFEGASSSKPIIDLTETTISEVEEAPLDEKSSLDENKSDGDGCIQDSEGRLEQHQPLLLAPSWSSSDETPLITNGRYTGYTRRNNNRKNKVYGETSFQDYWKQQQQQQQQQKQKVRRQHHQKSKSSKAVTNMDSNCSAPSFDPLLPAIVVDPSQLRSIGVKSMMAVCNGIGSLFLSKEESSESPMRRRSTRTTQLYKKLSPENSAPRSRSILKNRSKKVAVSDQRSTSEVSHQHSEMETSQQAPYFPEALQASLEAEDNNGAESSVRVVGNRANKSPSWHVAPTFTSKSNEDTQLHPSHSADSTSKSTIKNQFTSEEHESLGFNQLAAAKLTSEKSLQAYESTRASFEPTNKESESTHAVGQKSVKMNPGVSSRPAALTVSVEQSSTVAMEENANWSLAREIEKQASRNSLVESRASKRIARRQQQRDTAEIAKCSSPVPSHKSERRANAATKGPDNDVTTPLTPVLHKSPAKPSSKSSETSKSGCTAALTPLAEPPPLRRINVSLEIDESFGTSQSHDVGENDELPSLSRSFDSASHAVSQQQRSPMSDFLASRMLDTEKPSLSTEAGGSDSSSTGDLVSTLDNMVKDLHGLVRTRRNSADVWSTEAPSFTQAVVVETETVPTKIAPERSEHPNDGCDGLPVLVSSLNSDIGIPKGDAMLSLLNNEHRETSPRANRVDEAIWRCRTMRRHCDTRWLEDKAHRKPGEPTEARTSICVDVDNVRVVGGIEKIDATQKSAIEHIKYDDFEDALALYEDIYRSYVSYAEDSTRIRSSEQKGDDYFQRYLGAALHNLGIIHLLKSEHDEALNHFELATQIRSKCLGIGHVDHITSLVKTALCRFAVEDYSMAHSDLREALKLSREETVTLSDHRQLAEILNNLGCLSYLGGEIESAMLYFNEAVHIQNIVSEHSMYIGSKFACHSAQLNTSITKANIGFLSLVMSDISGSVSMFESALKGQQFLLRDAHMTLISTMEHLVVANILEGRKVQALQLLRRISNMQSDAFGPEDVRCQITRTKISMLESQESAPQDELDEALRSIPVLDESREEHQLKKPLLNSLMCRREKKSEDSQYFQKSRIGL